MKSVVSAFISAFFSSFFFSGLLFHIQKSLQPPWQTCRITLLPRRQCRPSFCFVFAFNDRWAYNELIKSWVCPIKSRLISHQVGWCSTSALLSCFFARAPRGAFNWVGSGFAQLHLEVVMPTPSSVIRVSRNWRRSSSTYSQTSHCKFSLVRSRTDFSANIFSTYVWCFRLDGLPGLNRQLWWLWSKSLSEQSPRQQFICFYCYNTVCFPLTTF